MTGFPTIKVFLKGSEEARPAPIAPWTRARSFPAWAEPEGSCSLEQAE